MNPYTTAILVPAAVYLLLGKLSQLMVLPAGYPNLLWPPAGLALALVLIMGNRACLGVALGASVLNIWRSLGEAVPPPAGDMLLAATGIGLGAGLQALAGAWLVRRYVGSPGALDTGSRIALFLLLGAGAGCLVNASIGSGVLFFMGWAAPDALLETFSAWWLGDVMGVIIVAPLVFVLGAEPHALWRRRRFSLGVPLGGILVLVIASFAAAAALEEDRITADLERRAGQIADNLVLHLQPRLARMDAVASLMETYGSVDERRLAVFIEHLQGPLTDEAQSSLLEAQVFQWIPWTELAAPGRAEEVSGEDALAHLRITLRPHAGWTILDQDLGAVPGGIAAVESARDTGLSAATAPLELSGEHGPQRGFLVFWPVYEDTVHSIEARQQSLRGFICAPVFLVTLVRDALHPVGVEHMRVRLWDRTDAAGSVELYTTGSATGEAPLRGHAEQRIAGRLWYVELVPTASALHQARTWHAPVLMGANLLIAGLLSALLLLGTGHAARIEARAAAQAEELSRARASLQQSEFLRRLAESDVVGIILSDAKGGLHQANDAFLAMIGYSRADLEQGRLDWLALTPPEFHAVDAVAIEQVATTGSAPAWEKEYIRKDGSRVPVMIGVAPVGGPDNLSMAFVADLTKVKEAEAELKRQAMVLERYRIIIDSAPMAIFAKEYSDRQEGVYILANPVASEILGGAQVLGVKDHDLFTPEDAREMEAQDRAVLAGGVPVVLEEARMGVGMEKAVWFLTTKIPLFDAEGKPYAVAGLSLDVTERRLLNDRLEALVNAIPDLLFRINADGVYLDFKNNRNSSLEIVPESIIGSNLRDMPLSEDIKQASMDAIREALRSGELQVLEYSLARDAAVHHYEARFVKSGKDEAVVLLRDITEARRTREALQQANARLRAVNEELKEFAYVASHDLQEPLRTVRSFVEMLERRYSDAFDEKGRKWLGFIVSGTQRMRALIDDLLAYSRAGRAGELGEVDMDKVMQEIAVDFRASIEAASAELEIGDMPRVMGNETELRQVFQNLVSNALKFRRPDVAPRVKVTASAVPGGWRFSVADNGIGIEPEYHERIFLVFQRLHGRDTYPGTGIGLALVKKIVERQGGEIEVRSALGEGSEFRITLPASPRQLASEAGE